MDFSNFYFSMIKRLTKYCHTIKFMCYSKVSYDKKNPKDDLAKFYPSQQYLNILFH